MIGKNKTAYTISQGREVNDYYATEPIAINALLSIPELKLDTNIWEPACGEGHLSKRLCEFGYTVKSTDLIDRCYGSQQDFLRCNEPFDGDIVTNPPYKLAEEFIARAMLLSKRRVAFLLRIDFLEGKKRKEMWNTFPLRYVAVFSGRISCAKNGDFDNCGGQTTFAWYIWDKEYNGEPVLKWVH